MGRAARRLRALPALLAPVLLATGAAAAVPPNLKIAFIGDQGLGPDAVAVLERIRDAGADVVLHQGDFDYADCPACWEAQINGVLGANFPYFASVGNHDEDLFYGPGGYQDLLAARMNRLGIPWEGDLGVQATIDYGGITMVFVAPGVLGDGDTVYAPYVRDRLAASGNAWRIVSWHKNQRLMQVGGKGDETGWGVYEEARRGGAIIATAHEHSYSRTHLMAHLSQQVVVHRGLSLGLFIDEPSTPQDEGRSFVFVSGLGGRSIRDQELTGDWWASIYTSTQGASYGALFCTFNPAGLNEREASCYFQDTRGVVPDTFSVYTMGAPAPPRRCGLLGLEGLAALGLARLRRRGRGRP